MDINMIKQMQEKFLNAQKRIEEIEVSGSSGGGLVEITINASASKFVKVRISDDIVSKEDKQVLEDLIVAAFNNAKKNADVVVSQEMAKVGMPPEMMKLMG